MKGRFILQSGILTASGLFIPKGDELILPNGFTSEGRESFLKMMMRGTTTDVSVGGNFYIGICGAGQTEDTTLSTLAGEPSVTNGYSRKAVTRDATGFPTISTVNGVWRAQSQAVTFTGSGGSFSAALHRLFLCNVSSGTSGIMFSYSGALASPITIIDGASYQARYEIYLD